MKIQQYYLACLSHASYMITDDKTKTAVVVDPQRDIDQYIADAKAGGYTIRHVFLTHFQADFDLPPLNGTTSRERIWGVTLPPTWYQPGC